MSGSGEWGELAAVKLSLRIDIVTDGHEQSKNATPQISFGVGWLDKKRFGERVVRCGYKSGIKENKL